MSNFKKFENFDQIDESSNRLTIKGIEFVFDILLEQSEFAIQLIPTKSQDINQEMDIEYYLEEKLGVELFYNPDHRAAGLVFTTGKYEVRKLFTRLLK